MRPYFHLLLLFSLFQLTGCGEEEVVQLTDDPTFEETTDPADVFTVECANHAPELYLSVTDKEANPILHLASDGQPEVGKIGIRGVHYAESDAPGSFTLTYDPERARVAIYPEEMWRFLDRFEETGDSIRFYGKRPISPRVVAAPCRRVDERGGRYARPALSGRLRHPADVRLPRRG